MDEDEDEDRAPIPPGPAPATAGWALLSVLALLAALLVAVVLHADIAAIADDGWRGNALWAAGTAVVLLGVGLGAVAWTVASPQADGVLARTAVLAAVIGVVGAVVVVGVADEEGGEVATSAVPATVSAAPGATAGPDGSAPVVPDEPLGFNDALARDNITGVALPVTERTLVTLELTGTGRQFLAEAMNCRARDLLENSILGTAVGGTWVQPLVVVGPPVKEDGDTVNRCRRVTVRLPLGAGVALPRF